jgi:O-antigen ligase
VSPDSGRSQFAVAASAFVGFVCILGRYDLDRLSLPPLPGLSLRVYVAVCGSLVLLGWWFTFDVSLRRGIRAARSALVPLLIFTCYVTASAMWSDAPDGEVIGDAWLTLALATAAAAAAAASWSVAVEVWPRLLGAVGIGYFMIGLASLGQPGRLAVLGGGPNVFGRMTGLGAISLFFLVWQQRLRRVWLIPAVGCVVATLASGSRGATLSLLIASMILAFLVLRASERTVRVSLGLGVLVAIVGAASLTVLGPLIEERFVRLTLETQYTSGRTDLFQFAEQMFLAKPLFGGGVGAFTAEYGDYGAYAHNLLLQSLAEAGCVGSVFLILSVALPLWRISRNLLSHHGCSFSFASATLVLTASMFSGTYFDARLLWVLLSMGLVVHSHLAQAVTSLDAETRASDESDPARRESTRSRHRTRQPL